MTTIEEPFAMTAPATLPATPTTPRLRVLIIESMDQAEDILLAAAVTDDGRMLPGEMACKFFSLNASEVKPVVPFTADPRLMADINQLSIAGGHSA